GAMLAPFIDQREGTAPGKAVLAHLVTLVVYADRVLRRAPHHREEDRRAAGPEIGVAAPQPVAAIARCQRLHLRPERRHIERHFAIADPGELHGASDVSRLLFGTGSGPKTR